MPVLPPLSSYAPIFEPMVTYGLHHSWLTVSMRNKLDSWQARTLRRVLRIKASMISRVSNKEVLRRARCTPLSHLVKSRRLEYLGHVLRRTPHETIASVCFDSSWKVRTPPTARRRGRPLDNWARKSVAEVLLDASSHCTPLPRPPDGLKPSTSSVLFARGHAMHRVGWRRYVRAGTDAPGGVGGTSGHAAPLSVTSTPLRAHGVQ